MHTTSVPGAKVLHNGDWSGKVELTIAGRTLRVSGPVFLALCASVTTGYMEGAAERLEDAASCDFKEQARDEFFTRHSVVEGYSSVPLAREAEASLLRSKVEQTFGCPEDVWLCDLDLLNLWVHCDNDFRLFTDALDEVDDIYARLVGESENEQPTESGESDTVPGLDTFGTAG